jgi:protein phosphatase
VQLRDSSFGVALVIGFLGAEVSLFCWQIEYPMNVHLIRGNHEAADINALFGFRIECIERLGERDGIWAWQRINQLFNWLPLAALIEKKIICMHGGIGRSINHVQQIEALQRPITMEAGSVVLMDLLWSDPTENDSVEGLRPNARGPGLVTFGVRVLSVCSPSLQEKYCDIFWDRFVFSPATQVESMVY